MNRSRKTRLKAVLAAAAAGLLLYAAYLTCSTHTTYTFSAMLRSESAGAVTHCSVVVWSDADTCSTLSPEVDSASFMQVWEALQAEPYTRTLHSLLEGRVGAYPIGTYPYYQIFLQHSDQTSTEIIIRGDELLLGATDGPGLRVYQMQSDDTPLHGALAALR